MSIGLWLTVVLQCYDRVQKPYQRSTYAYKRPGSSIAWPAVQRAARARSRRGCHDRIARSVVACIQYDRSRPGHRTDTRLAACLAAPAGRPISRRTAEPGADPGSGSLSEPLARHASRAGLEQPPGAALARGTTDLPCASCEQPAGPGASCHACPACWSRPVEWSLDADRLAAAGRWSPHGPAARSAGAVRPGRDRGQLLSAAAYRAAQLACRAYAQLWGIRSGPGARTP